LRGQLARDYVLGSLVYSARHPQDLTLCVPRALGWYRRLLELGLCLPFAAVLDLGWLLLEGEGFRFRGWFADTGLASAERAVRERYETRLLARRLSEQAWPRLRRIILDNAEPEAALVRALELVLRPVWDGLALRYRLDDPALAADPEGTDYAACAAAFEAGVEQPGALLAQTDEVARGAEQLSLDTLLQAEDYYELAHMRVFPRQSLREVARRIQAAERVLGPAPPTVARQVRRRALTATRLASAGTYPVGGIAELTTAGPLENLVPSELVYHDPDAAIDPFLVRLTEGELLKYLRDGAQLHWLRRRLVFCVDECAEFLVPLTGRGPLRGTKGIRCLLGLVLVLVADLLQAFEHDDLRFELRLLAPAGDHADTNAERREVAEVLHLLLHDKEEQGTGGVEVVSAGLRDDLAALRSEPDRELSVVVLSRPAVLAELADLRLPGGGRPIGVAVRRADAEPAPADAIDVVLDGDPTPALQRARAQVLERLFSP
jgi:hypothetical protein